jgi:hypothetical protein
MADDSVFGTMTTKKEIAGIPEVLESLGHRAKLIADCRSKYQAYRLFKIRNPQSAFRNLKCSNAPKWITFFWIIDPFTS